MYSRYTWTILQINKKANAANTIPIEMHPTTSKAVRSFCVAGSCSAHKMKTKQTNSIHQGKVFKDSETVANATENKTPTS